MSMKQTKELLLERLSQQTKEINFSMLEGFSANGLASQLQVSRNLASQYLNELFSQGELIKINTRPVYFFCRKTLAETGKNFLSEYSAIADFQAVYETATRNEDVFSGFIGANGSLSYCVDQCKAAITYPGKGLPILLQGPTGTGKSRLAQHMYEYAKAQGIIAPEGKLVTVNCSEYANNPELFLTNLFGYTKGAYTGADKQRNGLASLADGGVLFLDEVHCLTPECQEKLFLFLDNGTYHMVGDNEKWYHAQVRFIFATTEKPEQALLKTFQRRIPLVTVLPSLEKRPLSEKKQLIYTAFRAEARAIAKTVWVSRSAYLAIEQFPFPENVGQLTNVVKTSVANGFLRSNKQGETDILVTTYDLPEYIIENSPLLQEGQLDDKTWISLDQLKNGAFWDNPLYAFNQDFLVIMKQAISQESLELVWSKFFTYLDFLLYEKQESHNPKEALQEKMLANISGIISQKYGVSYTTSQLEKLERFVRDYRQTKVTVSSLSENHTTLVEKMTQWFEIEYAQEWKMAKEYVLLLQDSLNLSFDSLGRINLFLLLKSFRKGQVSYKTTAFLMARGYASASSLTTAINQLLGETIFIPLDIGVKTTQEEIAKKLLNEFELRKEAGEFLLLSDMELSDALQNLLAEKSGCNIGVIANITTGFAVSVGEKIKADKNVEEILLGAKEKLAQQQALFYANRKKELAILSVCATGIGTAKKISDLMKKSVPEEAKIHFIQYDYDSLISMGKDCPLFSQYEVLLVVGTMNPQIPGYDFLSVEELVQQKNTMLTDRLLGKVLNKEQLIMFNQNLIKNFSLQNLLEYLTILNPEKIINHVEQILDELQKRLNKTLSSSTIVGLYLHISCLIERLVTNRYIASYQDIEGFQQNHRDFIDIVKLSFQQVEESYNVEIPVSEMGYLYEYVSKG